MIGGSRCVYLLVHSHTAEPIVFLRSSTVPMCCRGPGTLSRVSPGLTGLAGGQQVMDLMEGAGGGGAGLSQQHSAALRCQGTKLITR